MLLVDDNKSILDSASTILARECVIVGTASDGKSALEAAARLRPDVIVLDISMPDMCGLDVIARLHEVGSEAAVVFLTIHGEEEIVRAARETGAAGYVLKPRLAADLPVAALRAAEGCRFASSSIPDDLW